MLGLEDDYDLYDCNDVKLVSTLDDIEILCYTPKEYKSTKIIVHIPGSGFVKSIINVQAYRDMKLQYKVYFLRYLGIFDKSINNSVVSLYRCFLYLQTIEDKVKEFVTVCYSAGSLYSMLLFSQYSIPVVKKIISICGYMGSDTVKQPFIKSLDFIYNIRSKSIPFKIDNILMLSATNDFLLESTIYYATNVVHVKPHVDYKGNHSFFWTMYTSDTEKAWNDFKKFID